MKLKCLISTTENNCEFISNALNVNDLAMVSLKFVVKDKYLNTFICSLTHAKAKDFLIKVKVQEGTSSYCEWICRNDGQYKQVGYPIILWNCSTRCVVQDVWSGLLNLTVSASKILCGLPVKLYKDEDFTDFNLSCAEGSVAIHKSHMAAHSDVFKTMLSQEWKETKEGLIQIPGVTLQTVQNLKKYMYLGVLPDDDLQSLLLIASCYLMEDLKAECVLKLSQTVKPEDLYNLFKFAVVNELPELTFAIMKGTPEKVVEDAENICMKRNNEKETKEE